MIFDSIPSTQLHQSIGAIALADGGCRFCVWAPAHDCISVDLVDQGRIVPMDKVDGYHFVEIGDVAIGERYFYRLGDGASHPDPASRFQPAGVHGPSEVVSRQFDWSDHDWAGASKEDLIIYEMHVGAFTDEGTFDAACGRLDELVELGITAVELMPVADSAGRWNWGYDGVCLFAPNRNFGNPDSLRRFVDTAHAKGLAVILDVVYNHLGPEGNYWSEFGPYLSAEHTTPWGAGPNFDDPVHGRPLRRFIIASAVHWFDEYHIDALRVDAIHCMRDDSDPHITAELAETVHQWSRETERPAMMIAETNVYDPQMVARTNAGGMGFDAQWCDDFLHSVFAVLRPGEQLSVRQYQSGSDLEQTLHTGFVYQGSVPRGEHVTAAKTEQRQRKPLSGRVDTHGMIYSIQNHDFIGNHPLGQRLHQVSSPEAQRAAAALLLLVPPIPMLFMGEEFLCAQPFQFFVDFTDPRLREATTQGRMREYPQHDWSGGRLPTDPEAFYDSKIGPANRGDQETRDWYQALIRLRKQWRSNGLLRDEHLTVESDIPRGLFQLRYAHAGDVATVAVRLSANPAANDSLQCEIPGQLLLDSRERQTDRDELLANHAKVFLQLAGEHAATSRTGRI